MTEFDETAQASVVDTAADDCRYCQLLANDNEMKKICLMRDDSVFVIESDSCHAPHHYLVIAIKHLRQFADISHEHIQLGEYIIFTK